MKRLIDIIGSTIALVTLSPIMAFVSVLVLTTMGRPIFFRQLRPGLNSKPFLLIKFRTMTTSTDFKSDTHNAQRTTKIGSVLRSTSIDELPELWNIFRGEMSIVGPRPLLMEYLPLYSSHEKRRHEVKPGLTGWAQINGRNAITWQEKFDLDVWYIEHHSLVLDIKIIFRTITQVLRRKGVNASTEITMPKFTGSD